MVWAASSSEMPSAVAGFQVGLAWHAGRETLLLMEPSHSPLIVVALLRGACAAEFAHCRGTRRRARRPAQLTDSLGT